jgi:hypothetical protein
MRFTEQTPERPRAMYSLTTVSANPNDYGVAREAEWHQVGEALRTVMRHVASRVESVPPRPKQCT